MGFRLPQDKVVGRWAGAVLVVLAVGCGDASLTGGGAGLALPDGGWGGQAGAGDAGAGGAPEEGGLWGVMFGAARDVPSPFWWAYFRSYIHAEPGRRCYGQALGDECGIVDCRTSEYGDTPRSGQSAGTVTIAGGLGPDLQLEPTAEGEGEAWADGTKWTAGDLIRVSAPGAELPGFESELLFPESVDVLVPDLEGSADDEIVVDLSVPFEVAWTPTDAVVDFEIWQSAPDAEQGDYLAMWCNFAGASGSGVVPAGSMTGFVPEPTTLATRLAFAHIHGQWSALAGRPFRVLAYDWVERSVLTR